MSHYTSVKVLLMQWDIEDLGVGEEVQKLHDVLSQGFGFDVEAWRIPSSKPVRKVNQKINDWVDDYDGENNLFILYYAGHGKIDDGRQVVWHK